MLGRQTDVNKLDNGKCPEEKKKGKAMRSQGEGTILDGMMKKPH